MVFEEGSQQEDDITVLALGYYKGDKARAEISVAPQEEEFLKVQRFLRRQLEENGLAGPFYAHLSVAMEEAFALAIAQMETRREITVQCALESSMGRLVIVSIYYDGPQKDPFETLSGPQQDAIAFMRRSMDRVDYTYQDGKNCIILEKQAD